MLRLGRHLASVNEIMEAIQLFTTGGVYLNFIADEDRVQAGYGAGNTTGSSN